MFKPPGWKPGSTSAGWPTLPFSDRLLDRALLRPGFNGMRLEEWQMAEPVPGRDDQRFPGVNVGCLGMGALCKITSHLIKPGPQRCHVKLRDFAVKLELPPQSRALTGAIANTHPLLADEKPRQQCRRRKP